MYLTNKHEEQDSLDGYIVHAQEPTLGVVNKSGYLAGLGINIQKSQE